MCSLAAMPELLVSHSPPDYFYRPRYTPPPPPKPAPTRPCLASPPPRAAKKKVVFADDKGYSLTQVRVMREPSSAPPTWSLQFLAQVMRDLEPAAVAAAANEAASAPGASSTAAAAEPERWVPEFSQPASDYLQFRERLDSGNVSLENVIVRDAEGVFTGTVKVRNLSFHKEVRLRWTADGWKTYTDEPCAYVENQVACSAAYALYDTFSFRVPLPPSSPRDQSSASPSAPSSSTADSSSDPSPAPSSSASSSPPAPTASSAPCSSSASDPAATATTTTSDGEAAQPQQASRRVEFCVCFRCGGSEFWDNNAGANYALVRRAPGATPPAPAPSAAAAVTSPVSVPAGGPGAGQGAGKFRDALHAKLDSWSEFASWNHLVTEGPYW